MKVQSISKEQNFTGNLIVKGSMSAQQRHLFNLHKANVEKMIKDMPFDLFAEQSKSKKTIALFTDVQGASLYKVSKNQQDFEQAASFAISDGKRIFEAHRKTTTANEILEYKKQIMIHYLSGDCKKVREAEKELARIGVADFDIYKEIPNIKLNNIPWAVVPAIIKNCLKCRIYKIFSSKTPEEKAFLNMKKEHFKELKSLGKQIKTLEINLPRF